jgi:hypothetical protein
MYFIIPLVTTAMYKKLFIISNYPNNRIITSRCESRLFGCGMELETDIVYGTGRTLDGMFLNLK